METAEPRTTRTTDVAAHRGRVASRARRRRWVARLLPLGVGACLAVGVGAVSDEPLGRALGATVAAVLLLPFAADDLDDDDDVDDDRDVDGGTGERGVRRARPRLVDYAVAVAPLVGGVAWVAAPVAGLLVAAVAASMLGLVALLSACRVPTHVGVALVIAQGLLLLSWPVWGASTLGRVDVDPAWLARLIDASPPFALNALLAPTDPLTHRPLMYRLTNLGQDVPYALPRSAWPSIALHAGVSLGAFGLAAAIRRRTRGGASAST